MTIRYLALFATLSLAACTSAPTRYYTLVPGENASQASTRTAAAGFQFEMQPVRIPVQVDQPQVVVRESNGALAILETERWSAPLADEFHDSLSAEMERKLGIRDLAGLPKAPGVAILSLQTDVRRFDTVPGQYALIDVVWSISRRNEGDARRSLTCSSVIRQSAGAGVQSVVLAHQQAIATLATTIAGTAQRFAQGTGVGCP
ncbi:membrane integrity-associated transporter subunit PqiC [Pseudomonas sp. NA-150]|uniref:PqiC family protein n=1 Tax=Pseudomonas sp. NA-150 TaxID=3367525 RepID=UPI0037CB793A